MSPPSMMAFIAPETAGPENFPAKSPVAYTLVAPYSPSTPATADASPPMNAETFEEASKQALKGIENGEDPIATAKMVCENYSEKL